MSLDIANLALDHIGSSPLASLNRGNNKNAGIILRNLEKSARYVLKRCPWSELTISVCPDELVVCDPECDLPDGFCNAFSLNADFINVYDVSNIGGNRLGYSDSHCDKPHWAVRKVNTPNGPCDALVTDRSPVRLEYICLPNNLDALPSDIKELIGLNLAIRIAPRVKADKSLRNELKQEFTSALNDAAMVSGSQDAERLQIPNGVLTRARIGNYDLLHQRQDTGLLNRRYGRYGNDK